jgi:hypothetical protein
MEWLIGCLKTLAHAPALGLAALAKKIPSFVAATALAIPLKLKGSGGSVSSYARNMQVAVTLIAGRGTESESVYSRRIYNNLKSIPALHLFIQAVAVGLGVDGLGVRTARFSTPWLPPHLRLWCCD